MAHTVPLRPDLVAICRYVGPRPHETKNVVPPSTGILAELAETRGRAARPKGVM